MSSLLEQAIIDATALREAAVKSAEQSIIEKYAPEVKKAVQAIIEQGPMPPGAMPPGPPGMPMPGGPAGAMPAPPAMAGGPSPLMPPPAGAPPMA